MVKRATKRKQRRPLTRSEQMATIRSRDTQPELILRRALHAAGLRFRLHARELPGRPDVVFRPAKLAIFVHGCFWHRHAGCRKARAPATRLDYWEPKFERNVARDESNHQRLVEAGWTVMTLWECEASDATKLARFVRAVRGKARSAALSR